MTDYQHEKTLADHRSWLGTLAPEGLVVSPAVLADAQVILGALDPERQRLFTSLTARRGDIPEGRELTPDEADEAFLPDIPRFLEKFLDWPSDLLLGSGSVGASGSGESSPPLRDTPTSPIPSALRIPLPELHEELAPSLVLCDPQPKDAARPWLVLVKVLPVGTDLDKETTGDSAAWTASPSRRFERLLRETGVPLGLVTDGRSLRLVYAPRGESSGTLTFPVGFMREVAGRRVLAALEMLLGRQCLLAAPTPARLPTLLTKSRDFQASVSTALAEQVIDAAFELVRGFQAANEKASGTLLEDVLATRPNEVYEGLLTVLMRLVFTLYAEDRGLLPGSSLYQQHYGVHGLFERLRGDAAKHPDTMDQRFGAWAQFVALFRLIHEGSRHADLAVPARAGYLFNPDRFPWLEGDSPSNRDGIRGDSPSNRDGIRGDSPSTRDGIRGAAGPSQRPLCGPESRPVLPPAPRIPAVPDGTIHRVLEKLLVLDGERLSYRTLDVEQIGSVYEVMMGFGIGLADGPSIAIKPKKKHGAPVPVNLDALLATKPADRAKAFEAQTDHKLTPKQTAPLKAATTPDDLLAALEAAKKIARSATPQPLAPGAMLLVPSDERRRSGSNYTPRKLTEPIVAKTLEPILATLGDKPTPQQLLDLKVCDPAMGSGAFLVEACRQLAEELVVAWQRHGGMPPLPPDEDELLLAKRLVAQKCLYGVDKNPMAADLAKLSLWLATLAKDHPFTFLDHSLRGGDSLVGLTRKQIAGLHWEPQQQRTTVTKALESAIARAAAARREILAGGDLLTPEFKAQKLALADDALAKPRLIGDCVIAAFFSAAKPKARGQTLDRLTEPVEAVVGTTVDRHTAAVQASGADYATARTRLGDLAAWLRGTPRDPAAAGDTAALAPAEPISHPLTPFHWEIEFPEVFGRENPGFDAIVGNPPFQGGRNLTAAQGETYSGWLLQAHEGTSGGADLAAHFFRRAFNLLRPAGTFGLIATNTIAQGDTRASGLRALRERGGEIYDVTRRRKWPGDAAVVVSVVHVAKGGVPGPAHLDGRPVERITAFLFHTGGDDDPVRLRANSGKSFIGSYVLGMGFTFDDSNPAATPLAEMHRLLAAHPQYREVVFPYIGGEEVNTSPTHAHHRYVINFGERTEAECRARYPDLLAIVEDKVKPDRITKDGKKYPRMVYEWWKYWNARPELSAALAEVEEVLVRSLTSARFAFTEMPTGRVFDQTLIVFPIPTSCGFASLSNRCHESWARFFGPTLKDDLRYTPSDCFETFPFPENFETDPALEAAGQAYYDFRAALMVEHDEGLTKTYNRFHDPAESNAKILTLRELHAAMDRAVLNAYGWADVPTDCGFALDWLDLDDDELADTLASAPDDLRERLEAADYFFTDAAAACRFQAHIKKKGRGKLPWRFRWPDDVRDDVLARLLALNAERAELERLTGPAPGTKGKAKGKASKTATASKAKRSKRAKSATPRSPSPPPATTSRPLFDDDEAEE